MLNLTFPLKASTRMWQMSPLLTFHWLTQVAWPLTHLHEGRTWGSTTLHCTQEESWKYFVWSSNEHSLTQMPSSLSLLSHYQSLDFFIDFKNNFLCSLSHVLRKRWSQGTNHDCRPIMVVTFPCRIYVCDLLLTNGTWGKVYWGGGGELPGKASLANKEEKY